MCISWTIKCLILMHGATMKFEGRMYICELGMWQDGGKLRPDHHRSWTGERTLSSGHTGMQRNDRRWWGAALLLDRAGGNEERLCCWTEPSHIVHTAVLTPPANRSTLLEGLDWIQVWWGEVSWGQHWLSGGRHYEAATRGKAKRWIWQTEIELHIYLP